MRDIINTDRLILRKLELSDAKAFSRLAGEYDVVKMTGSLPYPFPRMSAEFKVMHMRALRSQGLAYPYAITLNGRDLIGVADLFRRDPTADHELGYWIGMPYWGQGYVTEAMSGLMREAVETQHIDNFIAATWHDNPGSMRVLEKLGFEKEGPNGRFYCMARLCKVDSIGFSIESYASLNNTARAIAS